MEGIFLLLGSNLGDKRGNLEKAISLLQEHLKISKCSSIYETAAWGKTDQPSFYNQVAIVSTTLNPAELLDLILTIEAGMGRFRAEKWGARFIDIDILYFKDLVVNEKNLSIPHPEITNRRFTLAPLVELDPKFIHPVLGKTQDQLLKECEDQLEVKKL